MNFCAVTVISVVFNCFKHIEYTIQSVLSQTYPNLEYIVIDGGSTDGTVDVIKKYRAKITHWISEPDLGIYDAMNKGLALATGRWVHFLNAGDVFYSSETIWQVFASQPHATVLYGAVEIIYPDLSRVEQPGRLSRLWQGMQFSHQAAFVELAYHRQHPFNAANRIAADLQFFYEAHLAGMAFYCVNRVIAKVITGGQSESNRVRAILASRDAICRGRSRPLIHLYYYLRVLSSILRSFAKICLPRCLVKQVILRK